MNLFEDDDVVEEGLAVQTWSMGPMFQQQQPIMSQNPNTKKTWHVNPTIKPLPIIFDVQKSSINFSKPLKYNVVEDMKKIKENILVFNVCKVPQQHEILLKSLKVEDIEPLTTGKIENKIVVNNAQKTMINVAKEERSKSMTPPFLLTFEIFNQNVHNCLVDSRASSNVMPYSICKKLNVVPTRCSTHITQLDRSEVKVIGELKDVLIRVASNPKVHQVIDIVMEDIPEAYGLVLSRDWVQEITRIFHIRLVTPLATMEWTVK
jgi:hypothetical protein